MTSRIIGDLRGKIRVRAYPGDPFRWHPGNLANTTMPFVEPSLRTNLFGIPTRFKVYNRVPIYH